MVKNTIFPLQRISEGAAINSEGGDMHTVCKHGHYHVLPAIHWDEEDGEGSYSSCQDYCKTCEEPIDQTMPAFATSDIDGYLTWNNLFPARKEVTQ
jgi:hypothetical protein